MSLPAEVLRDVTIAVLAEIKAGVDGDEFSMPFKSERVYDTSLAVEDQNVLHVDVCPGDVLSEIHDRAQEELTVRVDVAVRMGIKPEGRPPGIVPQQKADAIMGLQGEIQKWLGFTTTKGPRPLTSYQKAMFLKSQLRAPYIADRLREHNTWCGIVSMTYLVIA